MNNHRPIRVMFLITSMPVGGAETLLVNLVRRFDRTRITPMIGCLKEKGVLGQELASEIPVFENLIHHKYDVAVAIRLRKLFREQNLDAVITVGAGDKMFWGRVGAKSARLPVILSALHSTGWPDGVGKLNRMLTGITDGFIACADSHAKYLVENEKFPESKVFMIPNGINTQHFVADTNARCDWRAKLGIQPQAPVVGIVAALRPEKNHDLFLQSAQLTLKTVPAAQFVIAGDGPQRSRLEALAQTLGIASQVHFIGSTADIPGVLSMIDVFSLTSHNEAKPVSILEALSCQRPVAATAVGSVNESVIEGVTGYLVPPGDENQMAQRWVELLTNDSLRQQMGDDGRNHVIEHSSLDSMTDGYMELVESVYYAKTNERSLQGSGAKKALQDA
jgi:glycosyltransferase involved in cell wall biosynthesis